MSLLDCLCCPEHSYRTAVISDNLRTFSAETYGNLMGRACHLACYMRQKLQDCAGWSGLHPDKVVAIWAESCPEAVSGILGVLSVPAAYMPMSLGQAPSISIDEKRENGLQGRLRQYGDFTSEDWSDSHVVMETTLLEFGFVCAIFSWTPLPPSNSLSPTPPTVTLPLSSPPPLPSTPRIHCTSAEKCKNCLLTSSNTSTSLHKPVFHLSSALISAYLTDVRDITQCCVCSKHIQCRDESDGSMDCTINSSSSNDVRDCTKNRHQCEGIEYQPKSDVMDYASKWNLPAIPPTSLAYVMYTSGTTGCPKPVRVPHCCIVPNIVDLTQRFSICADDCIFNAAPLTFDPSVVEMFLALYNGASLLTVTSQVKRLPRDLANVLFLRNHVTVLQITPSLFHHFPERAIATGLLGDQSRVRVLAFGGEKFPPLGVLAEKKTDLNKTHIFNIYGITEVSSWSTCYPLTEAALQRARTQGKSRRGGEGGGRESKEAEGEGEGARGGREKKEGEIGEDGEEEGVPLGDALLGTRVEVREISSAVQKRIVHGYGEVYLGGGYRVCLLDDEVSPASLTLRGTGDRGWVSEGGQIYFAGRLDRQIKRWGHRISLEQVEESIQSHELVSVCAVATVSSRSAGHRLLRDTTSKHFPTERRLVAFTVPVSRQSHLTPHQSSEWVEELMSGLVQSLPGPIIPDVIMPVHYLPCNQHGKVDMSRLLSFANDPSLYHTLLPAGAATPSLGSGADPVERSLSTVLQPISNQPITDVRTVEDELLSVVTCLTRFSNWSPDLTLLELGATSFDIVRIANAVELKFSSHRHLPLLTDVLLSKNLMEVINYVWAELSDGGVEVGDGGGEGGGESPHLFKRKRQKDSDIPSPKRAPLSPTVPICVWRRGQTFYNGELSPTVLHVRPRTKDSANQNPQVRMNVKWSYNMGRCVDASPLAVKEGLTPPTVFIGSHSGVFVSLCMLSGKCHWQTQLSDRVESSACLSLCGTYIIVGCYDGYVYCLKSDSGKIYWNLQLSPEPVKSSACVDVASGLIWVGSHDHHLYSIDVEVGCVVHKVFLGGGACFSSPCIDPLSGVVYAATLQGTVAAVNPPVDENEGCIAWAFSCGKKPVFSSPSLLPGGEVITGCVDGSVYIIDSVGKKVRELATAQPVFSSCSVALIHVCDKDTQTLIQPNQWTAANFEQKNALTWEESVLETEGVRTCTVVVNEADGVNKGSESNVRVFCGSHDKCVYCWNGREGKQLWKAALDSEIYSTPVACTIFQNYKDGRETELLIGFKVSESIDSSEPENALHSNDISTSKCSTTPEMTTTGSSTLSCVCACTTFGGVYLLDAYTGGVLGSLRLPGKVFSSPVVVDNHIIVGCRDDHAYCLECFL